MSNAGLPEKPQNSSSTPGEDDIPAALRDTPANAPQARSRLIWVLVGIVGFAAIAILSGFVFSLTASRQGTKNQATPTPTSTNTAGTAGNEANPQETGGLLGHLPYTEAPEKGLVAIPRYPQFRLRKSAAEKFTTMVRDARRAGVNIVPISAFRSVEQQKGLFFDIGAQRNQRPQERAAVSAPPGYSEHHTGYAVDVGDGNVPATNLSVNFEKTKAFKWMEENAARYGFEMSFPPDNPQGVSYEPWHWRFVGDTDSLELFYKSRPVKPILKKTP